MFDEIKPYTRTITVATTYKYIDIKNLFNVLPITPYKVVVKKRGRKKKGTPIYHNRDVKDGSIITLKFEGSRRGVNLKNKESKGFFRNALTVYMIIDHAPINFKIYYNGKFKITGCKKKEKSVKCMKYFYKHLKKYPKLYELENENENEDEITYVFIHGMRNITFDVGFQINRQRLDTYINNNTRYTSLLSPSVGYAGINIRLPFEHDLSSLEGRKLIRKNGRWSKLKKIVYNDYIEMSKDKSFEKKKRHNTFLVFHSGNVIMTGLHKDSQREQFNEFMRVITECREYIEEKLD